MNKIRKTSAAVIIFTVILLFVAMATLPFVGCTRRAAPKSDTLKVETHTIYKDSIVAIQIPGETVVHPINYDSLRALLQANKTENKPTKIIIGKSTDNHLQLYAKLDSMTNQLLLGCELQSHLDSVHVAERNTFINTFMAVQAKAHETLLGKIEHKIERAFVGLLWKLLLLLLIWEGIKLLIKYVLGGFWLQVLKFLKGLL